MTDNEQNGDKAKKDRKQIQLGPARTSDDSGMTFFPDFALKEALTAAVLFVLLLLVAIGTKPGLEEVANPQASGYVPRPEWYFLWLFQTLKYFRGNLEPIGTVLVPALGIGLLIAAPFIDRREPKTRVLIPGTRPIRLLPRILGAAAILTILGITFLAITSSHPMTPAEPKLTPAQASGQALFEKMGCMTCHAIGDTGGTRGPDLTHFASQADSQQRVLLHFSGISQEPGSEMPSYQLSAEELSSLAAYLMTRQ